MRAIVFMLVVAAALAVLAGAPDAIQASSPTSRPELPALARDLPESFEEADLVFRARIRDRFPVGTPEQEVVDTLAGQGFSIGPKGDQASFEDPRLVCRLVWRIFWKADADRKLTEIDAVYGGICL